MQQIRSCITSAKQLLTSWVRLSNACLMGEKQLLFIQGDSFMDYRNSSLLVPEKMKQLGESQSKYEEKHICTFGDQKCSARHSVSFIYCKLLPLSWRWKGKHTQLKNPEKWSGNHCQNSRKFWSILADSVNLKIHVQSLTSRKDPALLGALFTSSSSHSAPNR